jgi:peroxiredoxin Q/BCP
MNQPLLVTSALLLVIAAGSVFPNRSSAADDPAAGLPQVGKKAPDFTLPSTAGSDVTLSKLKGKTVVLYFYPKDETPGCTHEACDFRDHDADLRKAGIVVLGVSNDDLASHREFIAHQKLPFTLLSDTTATVSKLYGVYQTMTRGDQRWTGISRTTFVIDKSGRIAKVWPKVNVNGHVDEVLKFVRGG